MTASIRTLSRRLGLLLAGAAVMVTASLIPAVNAQPASKTATLALPNGRTISVPQKNGRITATVQEPGLFIPAGFPVDSFPKSASDYPSLSSGKVSKPGDPVEVEAATYDPDGGHFSTWRWGGVVSSVPVRALIVIDRSDSGERWAVADWVYAWQNFVRQRLKNLGLTDAQVPYVSYVQETNNLGQCPTSGTWTYTNYSFSTVCTSWNIPLNCSSSNPDQIGCAWIPSAPYHSGNFNQPNVWIKAGLSAQTVRNNAHHELFHTLGMPHNTSDSCSVMWFNLGACNGSSSDKNLSADDDARLANIYAHNPD